MMKEKNSDLYFQQGTCSSSVSSRLDTAGRQEHKDGIEAVGEQ